MTALPPGETLGVMGGGQLGRMFVHAAQAMGYAAVVLDPDPASPAGQVAQHQVCSAYLDGPGLHELAQRCAAITTEFENVPAAALQALAAQRPTAPSAAAVAVCQDRALEKAHFLHCGVPCAPHALLTSLADVEAASAALLPGILKTNRLGYDGKGQARVADRDALRAAWLAMGGVPCLLEARLPLLAEISVIVARNALGQSVHLPVQRNLHVGGILAVTQVPAAGVADALQGQAIDAALRLAEGLAYVGVLCVEFFIVAGDGGEGAAGEGAADKAAADKVAVKKAALTDATPAHLVANEMAPRPHNSGHYSVDACDCSQFALQVRALAGLPLVAPRLHSPAVMLNLLGDLWFAPATGEPGLGPAQEPDWPRVLALPGVHLHLYGKAQPRPGRKMGHLTVTAADAAQARSVAREVSRRLGLDPAFVVEPVQAG